METLHQELGVGEDEITPDGALLLSSTSSASAPATRRR